MLTHEENAALSAKTPGLQLSWDSTSLGELKTCARKYYYRILLGLSPRDLSVHLKFGLGFHGALERYDHARAAGADFQEGARVALKWVMDYTWDHKMGRPWLSSDPNKNRGTLIRTVVWYLDQFQNDPIETLILANGKPAVELSFAIPLPFESSKGEPFILSGHLDRVGHFASGLYIADRKTTKWTLSKSYFDQFSPHNQFSTYIFAGKVAYDLPIAGLIVDAAQVGVGFSRFERQIVPRTREETDEWLVGLRHWLRMAEYFAEAGEWPMNESSCGNYGGCAFRPICSKTPGARAQWLATGFDKQIWDPTKARGDI